MQQMKLLHKEFEKELPFVHKTRLNCLMNACNTAANNNTLYLTGLGRKDPSNTKTSSNIEKANRLLGNKHLHLERSAFYQTMALRLIGELGLTVIAKPNQDGLLEAVGSGRIRKSSKSFKPCFR